MGQGSARIFNIVSIVFIALTLLVVVYVSIQLVASPTSQQNVDFEPTLALPAEQVAPPDESDVEGETDAESPPENAADAEPTPDPTATGE